MEFDQTFAFKPLPAIKHRVHLPFPTIPHPLGPLSELPGTWAGRGFNTIWRPLFGHPGQDRFLELNQTLETIEFTAIPGAIPNRGLGQADMNMFGVHYLQQITDRNLGAGLHIEPGIWAVVPATSDPVEPPTVVRMASIPHGTTMPAQGPSFDVAGGPHIADNSINPFPIGGAPSPGIRFPEQTLATPTPFRSGGKQLNGIDQAMVDNPNSVLRQAIAGQTIKRTIVLSVNTVSAPIAGGGTSNTAFLGPNADAAQVEAIVWLEFVEGRPGEQDFLQLQYTQTVMLNFAGLSWPHVSVATLRKVIAKNAHPKSVDPDAAEDIEEEYRERHPLAA